MGAVLTTPCEGRRSGNGERRGVLQAMLMAGASEESGDVQLRPTEKESLQAASTSVVGVGDHSNSIGQMRRMKTQAPAVVNLKGDGGSLTPRSHIGQINWEDHAPPMRKEQGNSLSLFS
jgi:hypothetical protein